MANYEGIAAMYMSMPMAAQTLPLLGQCSVQNKKISLKFPLSGVSFDLPQAPSKTAQPMEFKMQGAKGEMTLNIGYKTDMGAFLGTGKQDGYNVLTFVFYEQQSPLRHLKNL